MGHMPWTIIWKIVAKIPESMALEFDKYKLMKA